MKQKRIETITAALSQAAKAISGAAEVGGGVLVKNTGALITADRTALKDAVDAFEAGKAALRTRRGVVVSVTSSIRDFVTLTRDVLKKRLGKQYSTAWETLGFQGSLEVPTDLDELSFILSRLHTYLTDDESARNEGLEITPERCEALLASLDAAVRSYNAQDGALTQLLQDRDEAFEALRKRLSGLTAELKQTLQPLDGRWKTFGLNMPGAKNIPGIPENVIATLIGETAVAVKWNRAPRADYYRVWKRVVGSEAELVSVGSPADLDFTMEGLPRNSTIEIAISAVNNGGESLKSSVVSITTH